MIPHTQGNEEGRLEMTSAQRDIIAHTQKAGQGRLGGYFITGPGSSDFDDCKALVEMGCMVSLGEHPFCSDTTFQVTQKGRREALA